MIFHGEFLKKIKICEYWKFFHEFCVIHMQQIIVFNNKRCKWNMILQNLKTSFQNSGKYDQKGHFESWAHIGSRNLFYDKSCIFSKELIWHRSFQQEPAGNRSKIGFYSLLYWNLEEEWAIYKFGALFNKPPNSSVGRVLDNFSLILANPGGEGSSNPAETMNFFPVIFSF